MIEKIGIDNPPENLTKKINSEKDLNKKNEELKNINNAIGIFDMQQQQTKKSSIEQVI